MTITARLFPPTFGPTPIRDLDESRARAWTDEANGPGTGQFTLQRDDPDLADCAPDRLVQFLVDGEPAFVAVVGPRSDVEVTEGEEADEVATFAMRGSMAIWAETCVYPDSPLGATPFSDDRLLGFQSRIFNDTSWGPAVVTPDDGGGGSGDNYGTPAGWPDATAEWIWDRLQGGGIPGTTSPSGDVYLRYSFTMPGHMMVELRCAADDAYECWIDNVPMLQDGPLYTGQSKSVQFLLSAGTHLWAVKATNASGGATKGGFLGTIRAVNSDGSPGAVVANSGADWKVLGYPATPPGLTPGRIIRLIREEAQARGEIPGMGLEFSDLVDSAGVAWDVAPDVGFRVGLDGLAALQQLAETYVDLAMSTTALALRAWRKGTRPATGVTIAESTDSTPGALQFLQRDDPAPGPSAALVRWAGGYVEQTHALAATRRRVRLLTVGNAPSPAEGQRVAVGQLNRDAAPREVVRVGLLPTGAGDTPYVSGWTVGSLVTVEAASGTFARKTVRLIVSEDEDGVETFVPELEE